MAPSDAPRPDRKGGVGSVVPAPRASTAADRDRDERREMWDDVGLGWTMAVEFLTATLVWGGIGWLLDRWLGTDPWLMSIGFVLGNGLGIYLLWLRTSGDGSATVTAGEVGAGQPVARSGRTGEPNAGG